MEIVKFIAIHVAISAWTIMAGYAIYHIYKRVKTGRWEIFD
jgi:hypothetical protein